MLNTYIKLSTKPENPTTHIKAASRKRRRVKAALLVEVQVYCPNCCAYMKVGRAEVDEETLRMLRDLLGRVRFRDEWEGVEPLFKSLGETVRFEIVG